jgi:hypothetical protein
MLGNSEMYYEPLSAVLFSTTGIAAAPVAHENSSRIKAQLEGASEAPFDE